MNAELRQTRETRETMALDSEEEALTRRDRSVRFSSLPFRASIVLGLHIPLGIAMQQWPIVATAHAAMTLAVALFVAMGSRVERIVYAGAYFCGAEVLWRMTHSRSPWEFSKYAIILLFAIAIIRQRPWRLHWPSVLFALLLMPSAALTMLGLEPGEARSQIAFNLAGPVALAISVWLLSMVDLGTKERRRLVLALVAPMLSIATITAVGTYLVGGIQFGTESNFASSGGFGPNQVSGILGFGALAAFLASFDRSAGIGYRMIMLAMTLILAVQSAMTFSRGGLLVAAVAAFSCIWYLVRDRGSRLRLMAATIVFSLAGVYIVLPKLDAFTGGALSARFADHNLTKRDEVIRDDIDIFVAHPVLGVGPGMAKKMRVRSNVGAAPVAAHTEFSRLVAEHGLLGLGALILLFVMCFNAWKRAVNPHTRALATGYVVWGMAFMLQSGMRLVAPSLALGLAYAFGRARSPRRQSARPEASWKQSAALILARSPISESTPVSAGHAVALSGPGLTSGTLE